MTSSPQAPRAARIDDAAFGAIYGSISVMGILAACIPATRNPLMMAGTLFSSLLAVGLAKAYADLASTVLATARPASLDMVATVWSKARTTLLAVNLPTLAMLGGAMGLYGADTALVLAQVFAIALLIFYGARIGFRLSGTLAATCLGGAFTGAIGVALSVLKTLVH